MQVFRYTGMKVKNYERMKVWSTKMKLCKYERIKVWVYAIIKYQVCNHKRINWCNIPLWKYASMLGCKYLGIEV